jgi:hypothetical protein
MAVKSPPGRSLNTAGDSEDITHCGLETDAFPAGRRFVTLRAHSGAPLVIYIL